MNKAEKKFRIYATVVIFVLLTVLLTVINVVNFTMAAQDADEITMNLSMTSGAFEQNAADPNGLQIQPDQNIKDQPKTQAQPGRENNAAPDLQTVPDGGAQFKRGKNGEFRFGPMGPDSPEMNASLRYFTFAFDEDGDAETAAFNISAVTEDEAREWAYSLVKEKTGWTRGIYRYRVYEKNGKTFVTVIDQGRELLPSYRILIISAIGEALCLIIGWFVLMFISKRIYAPIEEADRKQKNFINNANKEFRIPLTVISGNTELIEKKYGPDEQTASTRRQIGRLNALVDRLGDMGVFEEEKVNPDGIPVSEILSAAIERQRESFSSRGIELTADIASDVTLAADAEAVKKMIDELISNALKFSQSKASFALKKENGYVLLLSKNDTELPDGPADQAFDRFTVLDNAKDKESGAGLGLAYVKQIVKAHNGRATASVEHGEFTVRITL